MKSTDKEIKALKHTERRQKYQLKKTRRRKKWLNRKRKSQQGESRKVRVWKYLAEASLQISVPREFSLVQFPEKVLQFINSLKRLGRRKKPIYILMSQVEVITHDAIAMLLSVIGELEEQRISGNYPRDKSARRILVQSGFFDYVRGYQEDKEPTRNTILTKGMHTVQQQKTAPIVRDAMETVWERNEPNKPIQGMLVELMANSVNHAFPENVYKKHEIRWWLSVNHDEDRNKVSFAFVDNGVGIIETLFLKPHLNLGQYLRITNNAEILNMAFNGKIGSSTRLDHRGLGLPSILKVSRSRVISNLTVITNNVYLQFGTDEKRILETPFSGTFYYWELDKSCFKFV